MGWVILLTRLSFGWPCMVQGPKFKILLPRSCISRPIEYRCQVSSTLAQRSRSLRVLKMLTPHGRTFDQFYWSSRKRGTHYKNVNYHPGKRGQCWDHTSHTSHETCNYAVPQLVDVHEHHRRHVDFSHWLHPECQLWQSESRACHETGRDMRSWNKRRRNSAHCLGWIPAGRRPSSVQTVEDKNRTFYKTGVQFNTISKTVPSMN